MVYKLLEALIGFPGVGGAVSGNEDMLLGRLAVREGVCTQEQVDECLRIQSMNRSSAPLGDILLYKGYLTDLQLKNLLARQHKKVMTCPACRLSFTVVTLTEGKSARCPRCKGLLQGIAAGMPTRTDAEFSTRKIPTAPTSRTSLVKFACIICDHAFQAEPDLSGRVRCPSCQSSFLPK